jgi:hypothetical protein
MVLNRKPDTLPDHMIHRKQNHMDPSLPYYLGLQSLIKDGAFRAPHIILLDQISNVSAI